MEKNKKNNTYDLPPLPPIDMATPKEVELSKKVSSHFAAGAKAEADRKKLPPKPLVLPPKGSPLDATASELRREIMYTANNQVQASIIHNNDRLDNQTKASASDMQVLKGMANTFALNNPAVKYVGKALTDYVLDPMFSGEEDKNFKAGLSPEIIQSKINEYGLSYTPSNLDFIAGSINQKSFNARLNILRKQNEFGEMSKYLSASQQTFSTITGAVADPLNFAFLPARALSMFKMSSSLLAVGGANAGLQYGLSKIRDYGDSSRDELDTAIDVFGGFLFDGYLSVRSLRKAQGITPAGSEDEAILRSYENMSEGASAVKEAKKYSTALTVIDGEKSQFKTLFEDAPYSPTKKATAAETVKEVAKRTVDDVVSVYDKYTQLSTKAKSASDANSIKSYSKVRDEQRALVKGLSEKIRTTKGQERENYVSILNDIRASNKREGLDKIDSAMKYGESSYLKEAKSKTEYLNRKQVEQAQVISSLKSTIKSKSIDLKKSLDDIKKFDGMKPNELATNGLTKPMARRLGSIAKEIDKTKSKAKQTKATRQKIKMLQDEATNIKLKAQDNIGMARSGASAVLAKQKDLYKAVSTMVDEIMYDTQKAFNDFILDKLPSEKDKELFVDAIYKDLKALDNESNFSLDFVNGNLTIKGEIKANVDADGNVGIFGSKLPLYLLLGASPSFVFAGTGDDDSFFEVIIKNAPFIIFAGAIGFFSHSKITKAGGYTHIFKTAGKQLKSVDVIGKALTDPKNISFNETRAEIADALNTSVINSYEHVKKYGSPLSVALGNKLGYDAINPQGFMDATTKKLAYLRKDEALVHQTMKQYYPEWLKETDKMESVTDKGMSPLHGTELENQFAHLVTRYIEFGDEGIEVPNSVKQAAEKIRPAITNTYNRANKNNAIGFGGEANPNHIPRIALRQVFKLVVDSGKRDELVDRIATAIAVTRGKPKEEFMEVAEGYVDYQSRTFNAASTTIDDVNKYYKAMKKLFPENDFGDVTPEELLNEIRSGDVAVSRGKFRLEMDIREIGDIVIKVGNDTKTINMDSLFDRNIMSVVSNYSSNVNGISALIESTRGMKIVEDGVEKVLENGINSEYELRRLISQEPDLRTREILDGFANTLFGRAQYNAERPIHRTVTVGRNLANPDLALSTITMLPESAVVLSKTLFTGGKSARARALDGFRLTIKDALRPEKSHTALYKVLSDETGLGSAMARNDISVRTSDAVSGVTEQYIGTGVSGFIEGAAQYVRSIALLVSQNMRFDDYIKQVSLIERTEKLVRMAHGKDTMSETARKGYGITQEMLNEIKSKIELDKDGDLIYYDPSIMDPKIRDAFNETIYRMVQKDSPEMTLSSTPIEMHNSSSGRLVSMFGGYSIQAYLSKGVRGIKYGDAVSIGETIVYATSLYGALYAKELLKGNEPDNDDIAYKTMMMMPLLGLAGAYDLATEPVTLGILNQYARQAEDLYPMDVNE